MIGLRGDAMSVDIHDYLILVLGIEKDKLWSSNSQTHWVLSYLS